MGIGNAVKTILLVVVLLLWECFPVVRSFLLVVVTAARPPLSRCYGPQQEQQQQQQQQQQQEQRYHQNHYYYSQYNTVRTTPVAAYCHHESNRNSGWLKHDGIALHKHYYSMTTTTTTTTKTQLPRSQQQHQQKRQHLTKLWSNSASESNALAEEDFSASTATNKNLKALTWIPRGGATAAAATAAPASLSETKKPCPAWLGELIGTFVMVFLGTGAIFSAIFTGSLMDLSSIAMVWAIAVTIAIAITASVSGAHLNPAMTAAFCLVRKQSWRHCFVPYVIAQVMGAMLASAVNYLLYASQIRQYEITHSLMIRSTARTTAKCFGEYFNPPVTLIQACFTELVGTAVLAAVVFALTNQRNKEIAKGGGVFVPPLIGATVAALICVLAPITQAGMNPARDFGPRIVAYLAGWKQVAFQQAWVYIVFPMIGAPLGALFVDKILYRGSDDDAKPDAQ